MHSSDDGVTILVSRFGDLDEMDLPVAATLISWLESEFSGHDEITMEYIDSSFPATESGAISAVSTGQAAGGDIVLFGSYVDGGVRIPLSLISVIATDCPSTNQTLVMLFEDEESFSLAEMQPGSPVPAGISFYANLIVADWMTRMGKLDESLLFLDSSLMYADAAPEDYLHEAYLFKADLNISLGNYWDAISGFTEALNMYPTDPYTLSSRARCYDAVGDLNSAIEDLLIAVELDPDNATINGQLGGQLHQAERYEDALPYLDRALELDPFAAMAFRDRSRVFFQSGEFEQALADINVALVLEPRSAQGLAFRGSLLFFLGESEEAIEDFDVAIELERDPAVLAWSYYARANCYVALDDFQAALEDLTASLECYPSSYTVLYLIGVCHMQLGNNELAEEYLSEYLSYPLELTHVDPWTTPDLTEKAEAFLEELQ